MVRWHSFLVARWYDVDLLDFGKRVDFTPPLIPADSNLHWSEIGFL